jgi:hypothetical protein
MIKKNSIQFHKIEKHGMHVEKRDEQKSSTFPGIIIDRSDEAEKVFGSICANCEASGQSATCFDARSRLWNSESHHIIGMVVPDRARAIMPCSRYCHRERQFAIRFACARKSHVYPRNNVISGLFQQ